VKKDRSDRILVPLAIVSSATCVAELLWLRDARFDATPMIIGLLFVPWWVLAAVNLALWRRWIVMGGATIYRNAAFAVYRFTSAGFALACFVFYAYLAFGT
jgi:hypothetical protein